MSASFIERLYEVISENPLRNKVVLASSFTQGNLWLEQMVRAYGPVLNVTVQTVESLALRLAKPKLFANQWSYLPRTQSLWLVQSLMHEQSKRPDSFIGVDMLSPGVVSAFHQSIHEMRNAQLQASQLDVNSFVNRHKGLYLKELLSRYEEELKRRNLVDFEGLLQYVKPVGDETSYIYCEHANFSQMEQQILSIIAKDTLIEIKGDEAFTDQASSFPVERTEIIHASGKLAELRRAIRTLLEQEIPLDQVEMIVSDYEGDHSAIYNITQSLQLPCTFSKGISVLYTKAGRTALTFLQWVQSNYNMDHMIGALRQGEIRIANLPEGLNQSICLKVMEQSGIGWGRDRYSLFDHYAESNAVEAQQQAARHLNIAFKELFEVMYTRTFHNPYYIFESLHYFMSNFGVIVNEHDAGVMESIQVLRDHAVVSMHTEMSLERALYYVKEELAALRIQVCSLPQAGKMHITSLADGGQTGREVTFMLGMDEHKWSLSVQQDPILLDEERENLTDNLLLSHQKVHNQSKQRLSRLGMIKGRVFLSYTSYDPGENKEVSPAYELLQVYRNKEHNQELDFSHLHEALKSPSTFISDNETVLDASDYWLSTMRAGNKTFVDGTGSILKAYPHLKAGHNASTMREHMLLGEYDGLIDVDEHPIHVIDSKQFYLSASKLELFAACPMKFFFQEILKVRPKESVSFDRDVWLQASDRGKLIHTLFQTYLHEVSITGSVVHNEERLKHITERLIHSYQELIPAPSMHILNKECQSIREDVAVFYMTERTRTSVPRYFELDITGGEEPFRVEFGEELGVYLKGFVDRIDETSPHQYKIIDYKTGNPRKFIDAAYFDGGTQLQHALYSVAVEQWLRKGGLDPDAEVAEASYYFPTVKGKGEEVTRLQNRREDLAQLIKNMINSIQSGTFPPTHNPYHCRYCDYQQVCGSHAETVKDTRELEGNADRMRYLLEVSQLG